MGSTVSNDGTIEGGLGGGSYSDGNAGNGGLGAYVSAGCKLTNGGVINGGLGGYAYSVYRHGYAGDAGAGGIGLAIDGGIVINYGAISGGNGGSGNYAHQGVAGVGVFINGGTLVTTGTISGGFSATYGQADAVKFGPDAATLKIDGGSKSFIGDVVANAAVNDVLELSYGAGGTLTNLANQFIGFTTITNDAHSPWTFAGSTTLGSTTVLQVAGTISVTGSLSDSGNVTLSAGGLLQGSSALAFLGGVTNNATVDAASGSILFADPVAGTGTLALGSTGTLSLSAGAGAGQTLDFLANGGLLQLANPLAFAGGITGFGGTAQIELVQTPADSFSYANGTLTVSDAGQTVATLRLNGTYDQSSFSIAVQNDNTYISFTGNH
jgi:hypothetical protein